MSQAIKVESAASGTIDDIKTCTLCENDGVMEGRRINERTHIWSCTTCPAILLEFINYDSTDDLVAYLKATERTGFTPEGQG